MSKDTSLNAHDTNTSALYSEPEVGETASHQTIRILKIPCALTLANVRVIANGQVDVFVGTL